MAKVIIGGVEHIVPELNFMALERAWPYVADTMQQTMPTDGSMIDPMKGPLAAMRIIAAGIMEDENFQPSRYNVTAKPDDPDKIHDQVVTYLRKKMKAHEMRNLAQCVDDILQEAGLGDDSGEENPVGSQASPSPETVLAS